MEVLSGLKPGDDVVTAGAEGLAEGTVVRTVRDMDPYSGVATTESAAAPKKPTDKVSD